MSQEYSETKMHTTGTCWLWHCHSKGSGLAHCCEHLQHQTLASNSLMPVWTVTFLSGKPGRKLVLLLDSCIELLLLLERFEWMVMPIVLNRRTKSQAFKKCCSSECLWLHWWWKQWLRKAFVSPQLTDLNALSLNTGFQNERKTFWNSHKVTEATFHTTHILLRASRLTLSYI